MMMKLRDIIKTKVIESTKDEDIYEPGSPTNFTFSTIGRLTMRRAGAGHRGGLYRKNNALPVDDDSDLKPDLYSDNPDA